mmetsp:Transcript_86734/g.230457  ORF Transcript_86734/g.230457 Transcript_86734/m.230457 type:complete len:266 (-) Transcript_86734:97-894(-)
MEVLLGSAAGGLEALALPPGQFSNVHAQRPALAGTARQTGAWRRGRTTPRSGRRDPLDVLPLFVAAGVASEVRCRRLSRPAAGSAEDAATELPKEARRSSWQARLGAWWSKYGKFDRKKIQDMGMVFLLSYGLLSNVIAVTLVVFSTYTAMAVTGASPLSCRAALRQFGITYAGLYVISSLTRPLRFALAVGITPSFEKYVGSVQKSVRCSKAVAAMLLVAVANLATIAALLGGVFISSSITGVPVDVRHMGALLKAGKEVRMAA